MSIDLALKLAPGLLGDDLFFTTDAINIAPSLGAELLANGDFSAWTADDPDGWTVTGETAPNPEITQRSPTQDHADTPAGTGAANFYASGSCDCFLSQSVLTTNEWFQLMVDCSKCVAGGVLAGGTTASSRLNIGAVETDAALTFLAAGTALRLRMTSAANITFDNARLAALSNTEQLSTHSQPWGDFSVDLTIPLARFQGGVVFNRQDASNYARLYFNRLDGKVYLTRRIAGTLTALGSWSATYSAGATLTARRHKDGTLDVIYNGTTLVSGLAATGLAGKQAGPFLTKASGVTISRYTWDARSAT